MEWFDILPTVDNYAPVAEARRRNSKGRDAEFMAELTRKRLSGQTFTAATLETLRPLPPWTVAEGVAALRAVGREAESARNSIRALIRSGVVAVDRSGTLIRCNVK